MMNADAGAALDRDLAPKLLMYVRAHLDAPAATYIDEPSRFSSGVEARVYAFRLGGVPDALSDRLVLRLFGSHVAGERARLEGAVQDVVARMGFPAARVLHVCEDAAPLGGPFMIMERVPGDVMLAPLTRPGANIVDLIRLVPSLLVRMPPIIADLQAKLHALDANVLRRELDALGLDSSVLSLDGHLQRMSARIDRAHLDGFVDGFEWVCTHRPAEPGRLSICHGDLWFGNVIQDRLHVAGVVDWSMDAMLIGDPAYDVGVTSVGLRVGGADVPFPVRPISALIQVVLLRAFLRAYRGRAPLETDAVRYYQLLRCVDFLSWVAERRVSPSLKTRDQRDMLDIKGATEGYVSFFRKRTGITLVMPTASHSPSR
jgi:aminoglycoside phosphotransferase (APT) family kinase protein